MYNQRRYTNYSNNISARVKRKYLAFSHPNVKLAHRLSKISQVEQLKFIRHMIRFTFTQDNWIYAYRLKTFEIIEKFPYYRNISAINPKVYSDTDSVHYKGETT